MLFNSTFRNINVTLLSSQIRPQCCMMHVLKSEVFIQGGWGEGGLGPILLNFLDPCLCGEDTASDHYLLVMKMKTKLHKTPDGIKINARFDTEKLENEMVK